MNTFFNLISKYKKTGIVLGLSLSLVLSVSFINFTGASDQTVSCTENSAVALVGSLPATMQPGQTQSFQVKLTNNGNSWWYHGTFFKFVQKSNLTLTPTYGHISPSMRPADVQVKDFVLTAPTQPGTYTLNMQMVHNPGADYQNANGDACGTAPTQEVFFGQVLSHTFTVATSAPTPTVEDCNSPWLYLTGDITDDGMQSGIAKAKITNNSNTCTYTVGLSSYKMFEQENLSDLKGSWLMNQKLFQTVNFTLAPKQTLDVDKLKVAVPDCHYQLDLHQGSAITPPVYNTPGHFLADYAFGNKPLCSDHVPKCNLTISKETNRTSASVNDEIEYTINFKNQGDGACNNVKVKDVLNSNLEFVKLTQSSNVLQGAFDSSNRTVTWNVGTLDASETGWARVTAKTKSIASCSTIQIPNQAAVIANEANKTSNTVTTSVTNSSGCSGSSVNVNIDKLVRNVTKNEPSFVDSTTANPGEQVEFQIKINVNGNTSANHVQVSDVLPANFTLNFVSGDSVSATNNNTIFNFGTLNSGSSKTLYIFATLASAGNFPNGSSTWTNTAFVSSSNAGSDSDPAQVVVNRSVQGSSVNLVLSKRAFNVTRGVDATTVTAQSGDLIRYTLKVQNTGNANATAYVFEDKIADILLLAELSEFPGATLQFGDNSLKWSAVDIQANQTVEKTFTVKVRPSPLAGSDNVMVNFFGNEVRVNVGRVSGTFVAPKTGTPAALSLIFSITTMLSVAVVRRFRKLTV